MAESRPSSGVTPGQQPGGIPLGRFFGVPILLAPSWFLMALVITVGYGGNLAARDDIGDVAGYVGGMAFAVLLALSVLAHELAHTAASQRLGIPVRRVTLFLLGGVSETTREPRSPGEEYLVSVVGPLVSLVIGAAATIALDVTSLSGLSEALVLQVAFANVLVGVFNLLPGLPLDGGRLLRAVVWHVSGDRVAATSAAGAAGKVVAALLCGVAGLLIFQGEMAAVANALILVILALFIWAGAEGAVRGARLEAGATSIRMADLLRPTLVVPGYLPLSEAVRRARETGARAIVVADSYGRPSSVVREADVLSTPAERQPWVQVSGAATRLTSQNTLSETATAADLLAHASVAGVTELVVLDESGSVLGVIATSDIAAALGRKA